MLEVVWLLSAIELNGALLSRGASVALTDSECLVQSKTLASALDTEHLREHPHHKALSLPRAQCDYDPENNVLKIRVPLSSLARKTLTLSENAGPMGIALLHDPRNLAQQKDYSSQPFAKPIPALAFDVFLGSGLRGLGAVASHGPWLIQQIRQSAAATATQERATLDYLSQNGGQFRLGDFRTERGADQLFGEFRGISLTNRAAPLRGEGKAQSFLPISSPSKVQFFDRQGVPVYSSEILPPGNYQVQGYGASTVPGFLEARLVDINGLTQSVLLPWSADRKLLSEHQLEWDAFYGRPRSVQGTLGNTFLSSAMVRYGMTSSVTSAIHAEQFSDRHRVALEASSRMVPAVIATGAAGRYCDDRGCSALWLAESRVSLNTRNMFMAGLSQSADTVLAQRRVRLGQAGLSGAINDTLSASINLGLQQAEGREAQKITTLSIHHRMSPYAGVQFQLRHNAGQNLPAWMGFVGLSLSFAPERIHMTSYLNHRTKSGSQPAASTPSIQIGHQSPSVYGPQINFSHTHDASRRSDAFLRYASPYGDVSMRGDTQTQTRSWSASSRLWITEERIILAPAGDENLVLQQLGVENIRVQHRGRDHEKSNADGLAVFRKAPVWTDTTYTIDARSIPFGLNLAASRVRLPLATNRAYLVDYRPLWTRAQSWRIAAIPALDALALDSAKTATGQPVFISADGYADVQSESDLPLMVIDRKGGAMTCNKSPKAKPLDAEVILLCLAPATL